MYAGSSSGSNHGRRSQIEGCGYFALTDGVVCKRCCKEVLLRALYVDYVRVLSSLRRKCRADRAAAKALNQVYGGEIGACGQLANDELGKRQLKKLLNGAESLAEFPHAGLLYEVMLLNDNDTIGFLCMLMFYLFSYFYLFYFAG